MKKLIKLILLEASFLKRTLAVMFVIFTAFAAAFLSVTSVLIDTPEGMNDGMDTRKQFQFEHYGGESFALRIDNVSPSDAEKYGAEICYAAQNGVTRNVEFVAGDKTFLSDEVTQLGGDIEYRKERHGYLTCLRYADRLQKLVRFEAHSGVLLSDEVAKELSVKAGDAVQVRAVGGKTFTRYDVLGVYARKNISHEYAQDEVLLPASYFYVVEQTNDAPCESVYFGFSSVVSLNALADRLDRQGVPYVVNWTIRTNRENIALVQTLYGSVAVLLGVMLLFVLYALLATLFRERKGQMCRFELLGATKTVVATVYCAIAITLILLAVAVASALSVLLSRHLLGVCTQMFGSVYPYHYRVWLPLAVLGAGAALTMGTFAIISRRMSRLPVAQEVRYE